MDEARWKRFVELTTGQPPWPELVRAAQLFSEPGDALDLGAGAGRDTIHLLSRGWRVTAVDSSPAAVATLRRIDSPRLHVVQSSIEAFEPGAYDLVNAQYSLPFIAPHKLDVAVHRVLKAVRPNGAICTLFFGPNDEWNRPGNEIVFMTRADVARLFTGWDVVELNEVEEDGKTADGSAKHWHTIHATARRPA
jgi:SAM-dependent methyltransferase